MCEVPSQEYSNGFCYDRCKPGWSGVGSECLKNCPDGFIDHGSACEPPSSLRKPVKPYMSACPAGQVDRSGNCFEPQSVSFTSLNGIQVPVVSGCNCIKRTLAERIQCPSGYSPFNNGCITNCPDGTVSFPRPTPTDSNPKPESMYCTALCPLKSNSKSDRWVYQGGMCVKEWYSRVPLANRGDQVPLGAPPSVTPTLGKPKTVASYLAKQPLGSSLNDRYRGAHSIGQDLGQTPLGNPAQDAVGDSWWALIFDPSKLLTALFLFGVVIFGGPYLFPLVAQGVGALTKGLGLLGESTAVGAGKVVEGAGAGAGKVIEGTGTAAGALVSATGTALADIETSVGKNVAAAVAVPAARLQARNLAKPLEAQRLALEQLTTAQEAYNRILAAKSTQGPVEVPAPS